jgi:hypothetical protein
MNTNLNLEDRVKRLEKDVVKMCLDAEATLADIKKSQEQFNMVCKGLAVVLVLGMVGIEVVYRL